MLVYRVERILEEAGTTVAPPPRVSRSTTASFLPPPPTVSSSRARTEREPKITTPVMEKSDPIEEEYQDMDVQADPNDDIDVDNNGDDNSSSIHFPTNVTNSLRPVKSARYHQDEEDLSAPPVDGKYLCLLSLQIFIRC